MTRCRPPRMGRMGHTSLTAPPDRQPVSLAALSQYAPRELSTAPTVRTKITMSWIIDQLST
jgi:hypothetical protein